MAAPAMGQTLQLSPLPGTMDDGNEIDWSDQTPLCGVTDTFSSLYTELRWADGKRRDVENRIDWAIDRLADLEDQADDIDDAFSAAAAYCANYVGPCPACDVIADLEDDIDELEVKLWLIEMFKLVAAQNQLTLLEGAINSATNNFGVRPALLTTGFCPWYTAWVGLVNAAVTKAGDAEAVVDELEDKLKEAEDFAEDLLAALLAIPGACDPGGNGPPGGGMMTAQRGTPTRAPVQPGTVRRPPPVTQPPALGQAPVAAPCPCQLAG